MEKSAYYDTKFGLFTRAMRMEMADYIRRDTLDIVNAKCVEAKPRDTFYVKCGKRALDIVFGGAAFIVTLPINAVIGVCTFFDVGNPIFFKMERPGKDGKPFTLVKFRNMRDERDKNGDLLLGNQRVTKFGKVMRRTSLDELLNFWSILKGDMSIIGPRPLTMGYVQRYNKRHAARLAVRPGLECPILTTDARSYTWDEQFENDVWYVENVSFATDVKMCLGVAKLAFSKKATKSRSAATKRGFMGYDEDGKIISLDAVPEKYVDEALTNHMDEMDPSKYRFFREYSPEVGAEVIGVEVLGNGAKASA